MPYKCHGCESLFRREGEVKRHSLEWCHTSYSWTDDIPEELCELCLRERQLFHCIVEEKELGLSARFRLCSECLAKLEKLGEEND